MKPTVQMVAFLSWGQMPDVDLMMSLQVKYTTGVSPLALLSRAKILCMTLIDRCLYTVFLLGFTVLALDKTTWLQTIYFLLSPNYTQK